MINFRTPASLWLAGCLNTGIFVNGCGSPTPQRQSPALVTIPTTSVGKDPVPKENRNCPTYFNNPHAKVWRGSDGITVVEHLGGEGDGFGFHISADGRNYYAVDPVGVGKDGDGAVRQHLRAPGVEFSIVYGTLPSSPIQLDCVFFRVPNQIVRGPLNRAVLTEAKRLLSEATCKSLPSGFHEAADHSGDYPRYDSDHGLVREYASLCR